LSCNIVHWLNYHLTECLDPLGMKDGTIKDCQISSSIESGAYTAVDSRADGSSGWMTVDRGPPFFQHEYIQVQPQPFLLLLFVNLSGQQLLSLKNKKIPIAYISYDFLLYAIRIQVDSCM